MAQGMQIKYFMQPEKNIALTRNLGVANATGDYIAFIDDDEHAVPDWLKNLYETLITYKADVVFGPVVGELPPDAPAWLKEGRFFEQEHFDTGSVSAVRGTGNVLLSRKIITSGVALFDPKFGLSGGSDTEFFRRLQKAGYRFIWCEEAMVSEVVPAERLTAEWLIRRAFRGGQVFADIYVSPGTWRKKTPWFFYRALLVLIALAAGLFAWPIKKAWGVMCFQKVASNIGQLSSLLRYRYQEYKQVSDN
jgi:succinoglycan biosynthesis protein ExoM